MALQNFVQISHPEYPLDVLARKRKPGHPATVQGKVWSIRPAEAHVRVVRIMTYICRLASVS
jgi:hypothetical protein